MKSFMMLESAIPCAVCDEIVKTLDSEKRFDGLTSNKDNTNEIRKTQVYFTQIPWICGLMSSFSRMANDHDSSGWKYELSDTRFGQVQYSVYGNGDHYNWHIDSAIEEDQPNFQRKLSVVLQLTDPKEYEGGDLELFIPPPYSGEAPKEYQSDASLPQKYTESKFKTKGSVIVFPSNVWHRVTPVTSGVRKTLVDWIYGPLWR